LALMRSLAAHGGAGIGGNLSAPLDAISGSAAFQEWLRGLAAPQVLARAPEIRIR
jgi:hypothetical protein